MADLIERLRERAEFEDQRVLDEATAMGFVPEVYNGSQTGSLLLEAAAALEAAREDGARVDWLERHCVNVADEYGAGSQLYLGTYATAPLRAAIDQARGKAGQEG